MIHSTPSFATFESMAFTLSSGNSTVAVLLMYRAGLQRITNEFFNEITQYLEAMSTYTYKCQLVVGGDLNINVADSNCSNASRLICILTCFDCVQRVTGETQVLGGTLDRVITRSSDVISDQSVGSPGAISDHSLVKWTCYLPNAILFQSERLFAGVRWLAEIVSSSPSSTQLCADIPQMSTAESLFDTYETVLRKISDELAPVKITMIRQKPIAVWFDDESRLLHQKSRLL
jgi:hypothetical protein